MPVKRRAAKRSLSPSYELIFWGCFFDGGRFLIGGAEMMLGLPPGGDHTEAAREAWQRLGHLHDGDGAWARKTFGEPGHAD